MADAIWLTCAALESPAERTALGEVNIAPLANSETKGHRNTLKVAIKSLS